MGLVGKVVAVTGAGSGIGRACALAYASEGALVAVTDIGARADAVAREIVEAGGRATAWSLDVTDREAIPGVVDAIGGTLGPVDVSHNNAGVSTMGRLRDFPAHDGGYT